MRVYTRAAGSGSHAAAPSTKASSATSDEDDLFASPDEPRTNTAAYLAAKYQQIASARESSLIASQKGGPIRGILAQAAAAGLQPPGVSPLPLGSAPVTLAALLRMTTIFYSTTISYSLLACNF